MDETNIFNTDIQEISHEGHRCKDTVLNANKVNTLIKAGFVEHTWPHIPNSVKITT